MQPTIPTPPWLTEAADYVCKSDACRAVVDDWVGAGCMAHREQERAAYLTAQGFVEGPIRETADTPLRSNSDQR